MNEHLQNHDILTNMAHTLCQSIGPESVFIKPIEHIPFKRIQDIQTALNLESIIRVYYPQETHLFGITQAKIDEHAPFIDVKSDPASALELVKIRLLTRLIFDEDLTALTEIDTMAAQFPFDVYNESHFSQFENAETIRERLIETWHSTSNSMRLLIMKMALFAGKDYIAEAVLNSDPDNMQLELSAISLRIDREKYYKRTEVLLRIRNQLEVTKPTDEAMASNIDSYLDSIKKIMLSIAVESNDMALIRQEVTHPNKPGKQIADIFTALWQAIETNSVVLDELIHIQYDQIKAAPIDFAPDQSRYSVEYSAYNAPRIPKLVYILQLLSFARVLTRVGGYDQLISECLYGFDNGQFGVHHFLSDPELFIHYDTIIDAIGLLRNTDLLEKWYAVMIGNLGNEPEALREQYMFARYARNEHTLGVEEAYIEYIEEESDPDEFQEKWFTALLQRYFNNPDANIDDILATMERIDRRASTAWKKAYPNDPQTFIAAGKYFFGAYPELYAKKLPELMARIIDDAIEKNHINVATSLCSHNALSDFYRSHVLRLVTEYRTGMQMSVLFDVSP